MFAKRVWQTSLIAVSLLSWTTPVDAQVGLYQPKPLSQVGGPTGQALNEIYRTGVGTGFTGSSLNTLSLQYARERVPYVGQSTTGASQIGLGLGGGSNNKPFSNFSPEPTTSPYLNLFREDPSGNSDLNYQTLVRPQLQQQQVNQQVQRESLDLSRKLDSMSAKADFNPQGDKNEFPTGHQTVYHYYGHYYQMPSGRTRKAR